MPDYLLATLRSMSRSMRHQRSTATVSDKAGERLTDQMFEHEGRPQEEPGGHGGSTAGAAGSEGWGAASSEGGGEGEEWGAPSSEAGEGSPRSVGAAPAATTQRQPPAVQSLPRRGAQGGAGAADLV